MRTLFGGERRANPFENPGIPLTDVGLLEMLGGTPTDAGISVSEESSLQFATVYRCVTLLAGLVAGMPLKAYEHGDKSEVAVPALQRRQAGPTPFELWETEMIHALLWGNSYLLKIRNGAGRVVDLRTLHPAKVVTKRDNADKVFVVTGDDGQMRPYTTFDIMHTPGPSLDGLKGLSVVALARQSIGIGLAGDQLAARLFGNGALMSGILTSDQKLTQTQSDEIKGRWREKMAGLRHAHDIAVLGSGAKFQPLMMPLADAQFIQSRSFQTVEVCRWFGIPPHLAMEMSKSTTWGTGLEQQNSGLLKFTLRPWLQRFEQRISREIVEPESQYAEFLVDDLLRPDTLARYQAYQYAIMTGWMTRNEARRKENLPPLEGLDEPLVPTLAPPMMVPAPPEGDTGDQPPGPEEDEPSDPLANDTPGGG